MNSRLAPRIRTAWSESLNEDSRISFAAAAVCFAVGAVGWIVNSIAPGSTTLSALMVVAGVYTVIGLSTSWQKPAAAAAPKVEAADRASDDTIDQEDTCDDAPQYQRNVA